MRTARLTKAVIEALESRRLLASSVWAFPGADGHMLYQPQPLGDKIGDFSTAGYKGGTVPIPTAAVKATVSPIAGDNTANIQNAINTVSALPLDVSGMRGAVLLNPGTYQIDGVLNINASGVVLRGSGEAQSILFATTNTDKTERTIINVNGSGTLTTSNTHNITDKYVPVGAISFTVDSAAGFTVGDTVIIHRPSTQQWINDLGMNLLDMPWTPGSKDIDMDRTITHIDGNVITIDAPITQALDLKYTDASQGTNTISKYTAAGRLSNVGIENLGGVSQYDPTVTDPTDGPVDENHPWVFINIDGAINSWARNIESQYFGYACVSVTNSKYVTVQDSECLDPISQITGGRRYSFNIDGSQDCLFRNLYTREGRHDFVEGSTVTGPNVFVDDRADAEHADAGPHHRYSTDALWDNLQVGQLDIQNRGNSGTGHGWAGANQVIWNSKANSFIVQNPPTAQNWLIGSVGTIANGTMFVGPHDPGIYDSSGPSGVNVTPRSLYYQQLGERMAYENFNTREVRLGDADAFTAGDAADTPAVDATWKTNIQTATGKTGVGLDTSADGRLVPLTFNFSLDPNTYVVGASLSLGLKSTGGLTAGDAIFIEDKSRVYTWSSLGVAPPTTTEAGVVIDLSKLLPALQDGKLNLAILGNTAVDWATLDFQTASTTQPTSTTLTASEDATVQDGTSANTNFGGATTLQTKLDAVNNDQEAFLKFDLSSLTANGFITRAVVQITPTTVGYSPDTFASGKAAIYNQLSFIADDTWTESGITWNNKPVAGSTIAEFISKASAPINVDVTSLVREALAGDRKLSLKLLSIVQDAAGQITYASSENANAALRPQLIISTYNSALTPTADAYVKDGSSANTNFGTATDLETKKDTTANSGNNRDAFLKFDLTGLASASAGATLRLEPINLAANVPENADFVATDTWTETGITWNNKPAVSTALGSASVNQSQPIKFNVTTQAVSTLAGDKLLLVHLGTTTVNSGVNAFASREYADGSLVPLLIFKNLAPSITGIQNQTSSVGTPVTGEWFGVWDAETALGSLTVTATSSNTTLLPNAGISLGGTTGDRTFTLTPAAGQSGSTTVTITVTDAQGASSSTVFTYTVINTTAINGDQDSPNENDVFRIVRNGSFVDIYRNGTVTPAFHLDYATAGQLLVNTLGGDDTVTVDYSGGNPVPAAGLIVDGGLGTDRIIAAGSSGADAASLASGAVTIGAGQFSYANSEELDLNLGVGADMLIAAGNASVSTAIFALNVTGGGSLAMTAGSTLPDFTDLTASGATFNLNGQSETIDALAGSGTVVNNGSAAATLTLGQHDASAMFSGILAAGSNTLSIVKNGEGTETLSGANTFTGSTTVHFGALRLANAAALGTIGGTTTIGGGTDTGRIEILGNLTVAEPITLANRTGGGGGNFAAQLLNVSGNNTFSGNITLTSGGSYWTIQSDAGLLTISGTLTNAVTSNTRTLFLRGAGNGIVTGPIHDTNVSLTQLNKEDAGTWTLSNAMAYTGPTNINGGALAITAGKSISSATISVATGATFTVNGSIPAMAAITDAGTVNLAGNPASGSFNRAIASLTIAAGGRVNALASAFPGSPAVLTIATLTFADATAQFDLTNNELLTTATLAAIRGYIFAGQLLTTTPGGGLGYNDLGSGTIETRYTLLGDTNLDGTVNVTDLGNLASNFGLTTGALWINGDSDKSGTVNVADFGDLASSFGNSLATGAATASASILATPPVIVASSSNSRTNSAETIAPMPQISQANVLFADELLDASSGRKRINFLK